MCKKRCAIRIAQGVASRTIYYRKCNQLATPLGEASRNHSGKPGGTLLYVKGEGIPRYPAVSCREFGTLRYWGAYTVRPRPAQPLTALTSYQEILLGCEQRG